MRRNARVDTNQPDIVKAVRKMGCTVQHLHTIGQGCPDILIGLNGSNYLWEIKDSEKPPSARALTPDEQRWHIEWRGQVKIIESVEQAVREINHIRKNQI